MFYSTHYLLSLVTKTKRVKMMLLTRTVTVYRYDIEAISPCSFLLL